MTVPALARTPASPPRRTERKRASRRVQEHRRGGSTEESDHASRGVDPRQLSAYRYKLEPYVVAADIYSSPAHVGRGGWSWYTGAAAWLYRAGLESILGFRKRGSTLQIDPCITREWKRFEILYRHGSTVYRIEVENPSGVCRGVSSLNIDGASLPVETLVPLTDDGLEHRVRVVLG